MTKTISISEVRKHFADISDEVEYKGTSYTVLKNGKPSIRISPALVTPKISPRLRKHMDRFMTKYDKDFRKLAKH